MSFTNFDMRMFNAAKKEAESSKYQQFKVGCVIAYKGHIIGSGHNSDKSNPLQKQYNRKYRHFNNSNGTFIKDSLHAEIRAITNIKYTVGIKVDWSKVKIFVYRICNGKQLGYGNARPCPACMNAIKDVGIKKVFYTDDNGLAYLELK